MTPFQILSESLCIESGEKLDQRLSIWVQTSKNNRPLKSDAAICPLTMGRPSIKAKFPETTTVLRHTRPQE